jgi:hypothetical protein
MPMTLTDLRLAWSQNLIAFYQKETFEAATPAERPIIIAILRRMIEQRMGSPSPFTDDEMQQQILNGEASTEDQARMFVHIMNQLEANSDIRVLVGTPEPAGQA